MKRLWVGAICTLLAGADLPVWAGKGLESQKADADRSYDASVQAVGDALHSTRQVFLSRAENSSDPDADYDRLDGTGRSGKKVDVIEWEGNLEIHVYPAGSLKTLAMKLDKRNKSKPVMVIGYRFDGDPSKQLIRRAILGIDLQEGFKSYRDNSANGYDKIVITNGAPAGSMVPYRLEAEPTSLYPEGYPVSAIPTAAPERSKAGPQAPSAQDEEDPAGSPVDEDSGTIQPFSF